MSNRRFGRGYVRADGATALGDCVCDRFYYPHPEWCEVHRPLGMCSCCKNQGTLRKSKLDQDVWRMICDECWPDVEKWQNETPEKRAEVTARFRAIAADIHSNVLPGLDTAIAELKRIAEPWPKRALRAAWRWVRP